MSCTASRATSAADEGLLEGLQNDCDRSRVQAAQLRKKLDEERAHSLRLRDQLRQMTTTQQQLKQQLRMAVGTPGSGACIGAGPGARTPGGSSSASQPTSISTLQRALEGEKNKLDLEKRTAGALAAEKQRLAAALNTATAERQRLMAVNESFTTSIQRRDKELSATRSALHERTVALEHAQEQLSMQNRVHDAEQAKAAGRYRELAGVVQRERQRAANRASRAATVAERPPWGDEDLLRASQLSSTAPSTAALGPTAIVGYSNEPHGVGFGGRALLYEPPLDFEDAGAGVTLAAAEERRRDTVAALREELAMVHEELSDTQADERQARRETKEARAETERLRTQMRMLQQANAVHKAQNLVETGGRARSTSSGLAAASSQQRQATRPTSASLLLRPATAGAVRRQRPAPVLLGTHTVNLRRTVAALNAAQRRTPDREDRIGEAEEEDEAGAVPSEHSRREWEGDTAARRDAAARHEDEAGSVPNEHSRREWEAGEGATAAQRDAAARHEHARAEPSTRLAATREAPGTTGGGPRGRAIRGMSPNQDDGAGGRCGGASAGGVSRGISLNLDGSGGTHAGSGGGGSGGRGADGRRSGGASAVGISRGIPLNLDDSGGGHAGSGGGASDGGSGGTGGRRGGGASAGGVSPGMSLNLDGSGGAHVRSGGGGSGGLGVGGRRGGGASAGGAPSCREAIAAKARSALERIEASLAQLDPADEQRGSPGKRSLERSEFDRAQLDSPKGMSLERHPFHSPDELRGPSSPGKRSLERSASGLAQLDSPVELRGPSSPGRRSPEQNSSLLSFA